MTSLYMYYALSFVLVEQSVCHEPIFVFVLVRFVFVLVIFNLRKVEIWDLIIFVEGNRTESHVLVHRQLVVN